MLASVPHESNPFIRYWRGNGSLWKVFWLYGVATSFALIAIFAVALAQKVWWLELVVITIFFVYTVWIVVSVWRSAPNVADDRLVPIARALTIAWAFNVALVVAFLLLGLFAV